MRTSTTSSPSPLNPIARMLQKHHGESKNQPEFIRSLARECRVHLATAYRWINGDKVPDGLNTLRIMQYITYITNGKEKQDEK